MTTEYRNMLAWLECILNNPGQAIPQPDSLSPDEKQLADRLEQELLRSRREFQVYLQAFQGMEKFYDASIRALSVFVKVGKLTEDITNVELLCRSALEIFSHELAFENCSIMLRNPENNSLCLVAGMGKADRYFGSSKENSALSIEIGEGVAGKVYETGEYLFIPDVREDPRFKKFQGKVDIVSLLSVPVRNDEGIIGVLNFSHPLAEAFDRNTIGIIMLLSNYVGQMITITRLHEQIGKWNEILRTLAVEKEQLSLTLSSMGDGVITVDLEEKIILINSIAERLTGWQQHDAMGRPLGEIFTACDSKSGLPISAPVMQVIRTGRTVNFSKPITIRMRNGSERVILASGTPVTNKDSDLIGALLIFRDISERQRREDEIIREQKLASVGVLAGGIAHDFNNMLTGILGNLSMAKIFAPMDNRRLIERLDEAEKASVRAKALTKQLLTFAKGGNPIKKVVSVGELITEAALFALHGSNVKCEFDMAAESVCTELDEGQISQVMHNLVLNAQQSMPEGGTVRISCERVAVTCDTAVPLDAGPYIKIAVEDDGCGIPRDIINDIFDPYFTTKENGNGLGLSTCYSIVKKHNGYIGVQSSPGAGAVFTVYLPDSRASCLEKGAETGEYSTFHCRVLVTDDEEMVRHIAGEILEYFGCEVAYAGDGREAVELYRKARLSGRPFDIVMLDLTIPGGMGGREAIGRLREIDPDVKAIVVSGYSNDPVMAHYREYGFSGVVTKPFQMSDLNRTLESVLNNK